MKTPEPEKPLTPEEQRKADRALRVLYVAMGVMALLPFLLLWLTRGRK